MGENLGRTFTFPPFTSRIFIAKIYIVLLVFFKNGMTIYVDLKICPICVVN